MHVMLKVVLLLWSELIILDVRATRVKVVFSLHKYYYFKTLKSTIFITSNRKNILETLFVFFMPYAVDGL